MRNFIKTLIPVLFVTLFISCNSESLEENIPQKKVEDVNLDNESRSTMLNAQIIRPLDNRKWGVLHVQNNRPIVLVGDNTFIFKAWEVTPFHYIFGLQGTNGTMYYITYSNGEYLLKPSSTHPSNLTTQSQINNDPRTFYYVRLAHTSRHHLRNTSSNTYASLMRRKIVPSDVEIADSWNLKIN